MHDEFEIVRLHLKFQKQISMFLVRMKNNNSANRENNIFKKFAEGMPDKVYKKKLRKILNNTSASEHGLKWGPSKFCGPNHMYFPK